MRRTNLVIAALFAATLALAPALAFARAGSVGGVGSSMGSRGSNTYSAPPSTYTAPGGAAPMQRSMTPAPSYGSAPLGAPRPYGGSPFMSGFLGGMLGAGIGGLLFGHGMFGGIHGFGGFFGFLIQIFLIVWLVRFLIRIMSGHRQPAMAAGPTMFAPGAAMPMGGGARPGVAIQPQDFQTFEQLLQAIQAAWSNHDVHAISGMATPEMASYFAEQLSDQVSRGVRNMVSDVHLEQGDLAEAWAENGREYATVAMRFSMIDVTRDSTGRVVDGDPAHRTQATEIWTFVRAQGGGHWLLSAIQQAR